MEILAKKKIVTSVAVLLVILLLGTVIAQGIPTPTPVTIKDQPRVFQWDRQPRVVEDSGGAAAHIYPRVVTPALRIYPPRDIPTPTIEPGAKPPEEPTYANYTRLLISPQYNKFRMEPGDKEEFTVTVKNTENKSVPTQVHVVTPPYAENEPGKDWIRVEPKSAEIAAGDMQEYNVTVDIPPDADIGYYQAQIVFTNDTMWSIPYPEKFPKYVNACELSIDVWTQPKVYFWPRYISDRVKAGQSYKYEIQLENIGDKAIAIKPEVEEGLPYEIPVIPLPPYEYRGGRIPAEWLTIEAPAEVEANSTATVTVTMNVPEEALGQYYEGTINLNIDDPSIEEWDQKVWMNIEVWKQPTTPYSDEFTVEQGDNFSVVVRAQEYAYDSYSRAEEDFCVVLLNPDGNKTTIEASKRVKKREVSVGMKNGDAWNEGTYHVVSMEDSKTCVVTNATGGTWTLQILPLNVRDFSYTIEIGG